MVDRNGRLVTDLRFTIKEFSVENLKNNIGLKKRKYVAIQNNNCNLLE